MSDVVEKARRSYDMSLRAERSGETASRIRDEGWRQFSTRPYGEVTLAQVAEAAGVTVPTVIAHFGRKEDLFAAACEAEASRVIGSRDEAPAGDHGGAIRNLVDSYEDHGKLVLHLLAEEDRFPAVREWTDLGRRYHRSWVERVFEPSLRALRAERRERLVVQLLVATDLFAWKLMRLDMKLSRRHTEAAMLGTVDMLTGGG